MTTPILIFLLLLAAAFFVCLVCLFFLKSRLNRLRADAYSDAGSGWMNERGFLQKNGALLTEKCDSYALICMHLPELDEIRKFRKSADVRRTLDYLQSVLTAQLNSQETFAKTGPGTFCFLLHNRDRDEITAKLGHITEALNHFRRESSTAWHFAPVYSIHLPSAGNETPAEMLEKAHVALLHIPADKNYLFYDREQEEKTARDAELAQAIAPAIKNGEFVVYYQPKVRVSDRKIIGAEALIRRKTSREGLHSPDMFLPAAEQYRTAEQIDFFVLTEVCRMLAQWREQNREICPISVNLSRTSVSLPGLADACIDICSRYDIPPAWIEFDLREELLLEDLSRAKTLVDQLHDCGFRCVIDKFGSGLCSLQMLGEIPADAINLDRSFFAGDNNNRRGRYLLENVLRLAAQLQIRTTAVGIDSDGQVDYLCRAACDTLQGFYFFKPMPPDRLESEIFDGSALRFAETERNEQMFRGEVKREQKPAELVGTKKNIVLFSYNPAEDTVEFSDLFSPVLGNQTAFKNASALFRTTDLVHENDRADFFRLLERCQRENGWVENTLRFYMTGGRYEWTEVRLHRERASSEGIISGALADMSGWKNEVNRWKEQAARDPLTGLYNRAYFEQNAKERLASGKYPSAALLFVDVDNFKGVNDTYGHMFGDDVLCYMAKQILGIFRHSDMIARYGGDEFVVFAPSIEREVLRARLDKLYETLRFPYRNAGTEMRITATMGAAFFPENGADYETLLHHADCALYEAKERGKNQYVFYEPYMKGEEGGL
ncbi:MAG: EAL domain-containing protein [Clostridia bacterium]|nr:EAL domain-containing protein [Clostridia bacterium]